MGLLDDIENMNVSPDTPLILCTVCPVCGKDTSEAHIQNGNNLYCFTDGKGSVIVNDDTPSPLLALRKIDKDWPDIIE